ncbi:MAG: site-2 protease family protein [Candidatus Omnitrophica bacterium]|nr:site-2 protease family protein [Candidatus Omnitrophota bacterium]
MKWSFKIWEHDGVGVYIHATFLLLIAWIGYVYWSESQNLASTLAGIGFILTLFLCVLLHEFGHSIAAKRYGIRTRDITLYPIGGVAQLERMPDKPLQEFVVAIAGPAVNVVIAAGIYLYLLATHSIPTIKELEATGGSFAFRVLTANVILVLFNLLPAFPMDGGRALRAALASITDYARATQIAASIGQGMALMFGFLGLMFNPILIFIAFFVWIGAGHEANATLIRHSLGGVPVSQAMLTEFHTVSPTDPLSQVTNFIIAGSQIDFPVLEEGRLVGILTRKNLVDGLSEKGPEAPVSSVMQTEFATVHPYDMLDRGLARHQECHCYTVPVVDDENRLRGLLTTENIGEFLMIQSALRGRQTPVLPPVAPRREITP